MRSTSAVARQMLDPDAPRIDLLEKLPYRPGRLKRSDIKRAVKAVVNERIAAERAAKETK